MAPSLVKYTLVDASLGACMVFLCVFLHVLEADLPVNVKHCWSKGGTHRVVIGPLKTCFSFVNYWVFPSFLLEIHNSTGLGRYTHLLI